jgi:hypothetical protein
MRSNLRRSSRPGSRIEVYLDGKPVALPPLRSTLPAIRSYLERLALSQQRIICAVFVDGQPLAPDEPKPTLGSFARVEARSMDLAQVPLQILDTARQQTIHAREQVASAVLTVLINTTRQAREYWWNLTRDLKQPLVTLSLMPSSIAGPPNGSASLMKLRKWQLQQLAAILKTVDESCWSADPLPLSNALESRVLPWLDGLRATLDLWYESLSAGHLTVPESDQ